MKCPRPQPRPLVCAWSATTPALGGQVTTYHRPADTHNLPFYQKCFQTPGLDLSGPVTCGRPRGHGKGNGAFVKEEGGRQGTSGNQQFGSSPGRLIIYETESYSVFSVFSHGSYCYVQNCACARVCTHIHRINDLLVFLFFENSMFNSLIPFLSFPRHWKVLEAGRHLFKS